MTYEFIYEFMYMKNIVKSYLNSCVPRFQMPVSQCHGVIIMIVQVEGCGGRPAGPRAGQGLYSPGMNCFTNKIYVTVLQTRNISYCVIEHNISSWDVLSLTKAEVRRSFITTAVLPVLRLEQRLRSHNKGATCSV